MDNVTLMAIKNTDIGVKDGKIHHIGQISDNAKETIDAMA